MTVVHRWDAETGKLRMCHVACDGVGCNRSGPITLDITKAGWFTLLAHDLEWHYCPDCVERLLGSEGGTHC